MVSLRVEANTYKSVYGFFHTIVAYSANLQILDLYNVGFRQNFVDVGDTDHEDCHHAPAHSIHLKSLLLMYVDPAYFTRFFDWLSCPLSFDSLERLGLVVGGMAVNPSILELVRIIGKNVKHLVLDLDMSGEYNRFTTPLLTFTPSLRSLSLQHVSFVRSPLTQIVLFPDTPLPLQTLSVYFPVTSRRGKAFADRRWQNSGLDDLFTNTVRFPNLRLVEFLAHTIRPVYMGSTRIKANLAGRVEERFPKLSAAKRLSVIFPDTHTFWPPRE
ncbi:hypothetical protein PM082_021570 [Marasmius tenuissimus]|nr:hypothetical protein PM082_021570 [Marasmius tenuissimus]